MDLKYIPGYGNNHCKILILGECPTYEDQLVGKAFSKSRETILALNEAGINFNDCWKTTVSKFFIPPNTGKKKIPFAVRAEQNGIDLNQQLTELQNEITSIKPNIILGIGKSSLWATTGNTDLEHFRGSILHGMGRKFISTYNPEHLGWHASDIEFKGYWNRQIILADLRRAKQQSEFPEIRRPIRNLGICRQSLDLYNFINQWNHKSKMSVDIEASGTCIPVCVGLSLDPSHGITIPLWNTDDISSIPTSDIIQIWIMLSQLFMSKDIIGQNFNYDRDKMRRLGFWFKLVSDTMIKAHTINPELPVGLAFLTSLYTEEPFYKNDGMYHGKFDDLLLGCARDACVTLEIDQIQESELKELQLTDFYYNFRMLQPDVYWDIENEGFNCDSVKREELIHKYVKWDEEIRYELYSLTGTEINVMSPKQIGILIYDNYKIRNKYDGTGEEAITDILNSQSACKDKTQRRVLELILLGRRVRKSIGTYLMALPDFDGRMRTTYFICLDTGRTATGMQDPPIRSEIEVIDENGKKKKKSLGIAFQTMTKHGDVGEDIRSMYVP